MIEIYVHCMDLSFVTLYFHISPYFHIDFDELQRGYRRVYREKDPKLRKGMQRQFYHWNKLLKQAVSKSQDIITQTLYHGINCELSVSTFSGRYYGPVSTSKLYDVAKGFAGSKGRILEIYPAYGKKGLEVTYYALYGSFVWYLLSSFVRRFMYYIGCVYQIYRDLNNKLITNIFTKNNKTSLGIVVIKFSRRERGFIF